MNATELAAEYDRLYAEAEAVLKDFQPCEHEVVKRKHHCAGMVDEIPGEIGYFGSNNNPQCCCFGCKSWTKKGCAADRPLGCKTWLCGVSKFKHPSVADRLNVIARAAMGLNVYHHRCDRATSLRYAEGH